MMEILLIVNDARLWDLFRHFLDRTPFNFWQCIVSQINKIRLHLWRSCTVVGGSHLSVRHTLMASAFHEGGTTFSVHKLIARLHTDGQVGLRHVSCIRTIISSPSFRIFITCSLLLNSKGCLCGHWTLLAFLSFFLNCFRQDFHLIAFNRWKFDSSLILVFFLFIITEGTHGDSTFINFDLFFNIVMVSKASDPLGFIEVAHGFAVFVFSIRSDCKVDTMLNFKDRTRWVLFLKRRN
jgi:hypothetical protein